MIKNQELVTIAKQDDQTLSPNPITKDYRQTLSPKTITKDYHQRLSPKSKAKEQKPTGISYKL
jgi:hypothetical protein